MDELKIKQQVLAKIQEVGKILVTVSKDPSVDALSAALGLAMLLDKQGKYATAIFSGHTPPAIAFLEPEKTFDDTTDSLRDFIIALNKEKADHLRYKVEGDSVKIFITPYKTTITEDDLIFSQGDYNVELVIALGVNNSDHLDAALENHGQILHDATVITMTAGDQTSDLGGIDWHDANSSSLSEMVAGLAEMLKDDKKKPLLDAPIATALLTGIVAETDRFSNEKTTSKAMTVSASLMAAGADQQLIANELQAAGEMPAGSPADAKEDTEDSSSEVSPDGSLLIKKDASSFSVDHSGETIADLEKRVLGEDAPSDEAASSLESPLDDVKEEMEKHEAVVAESSAPRSAYALPEDDAPAETKAVAAEDPAAEPTFGGTLNATTEQAADDARKEAENDQNKTILSHAYLGGSPEPQAAPGSAAVNDVSNTTAQAAYAMDVPTPEAPAPEAPIAESDAPQPLSSGMRVIQPLSEVSVEPVSLNDLAPALGSVPMQETVPVVPTPATPPAPADLGLPLPPPLPDFSQGIAPPPPAIPLPHTPEPALLGDILAPEAAAPAPVASAPTIEPIPQPVPQPVVTAPPVPVAAPAPAAPGQFQIPGQYQ